MKVVYKHYRISEDNKMIYYRRGETRERPAPRGGMTFCFILDDEDSVDSVGIALCSLRDNFSYRMGRRIANGRAWLRTPIRWPGWAAKYVPAYFRQEAEEWVWKWISGEDGLER